jgi:two-component system, chemotaxis family, protein-glutamate methylesterase/glutaminase
VRRDIVVIGGSAGAIEAVSRVVHGLPGDFPAAVFVIVHFPVSASSVLPRILSRAGPLPASHARDGEPIHQGRVYVAPPDYHMTLQHGTVHLSRGPKENGHRPAVDPLFRSAAQSYGQRVVGVLLSGNLNDGTAGFVSIKQHGGATIVQSPESAAHSSMVRSAMEHTSVDHVAHLEEIPGLLSRLTTQASPSEETIHVMEPPADQTVSLDEAAVADRGTQPGIPSTMTCPECHGTLWEHREADLVGFRCRVGHAFTEEALLAVQAEQLEAALWTALRALEEHSALSRRLAVRAGSRGHTHTASSFTEQAMDAEHHASTIRTVLDAGVRSTVPAAQAALGASA